MEIACLITDANLTIIDSGIELIIHQSDERLNGMNEWCIEQHGKVTVKLLNTFSKLRQNTA